MEDVPEIRVQPGELYVARNPVVLQTILGSCVSATLWVPRLGAAALSHGVLPRCPHGVTAPEAYRYVDFGIRYLIGLFDAMGAFRHEMEVKLFGGADVLAMPAARAGKLTVGASNSRAAWQVLEYEGLTVVASDLGGVRGRSIYFHTATGEVLVRRLGAAGSPASAVEAPEPEGRAWV